MFQISLIYRFKFNKALQYFDKYFFYILRESINI